MQENKQHPLTARLLSDKRKDTKKSIDDASTNASDLDDLESVSSFNTESPKQNKSSEEQHRQEQNPHVVLEIDDKGEVFYDAIENNSEEAQEQQPQTSRLKSWAISGLKLGGAMFGGYLTGYVLPDVIAYYAGEAAGAGVSMAFDKLPLFSRAVGSKAFELVAVIPAKTEAIAKVHGMCQTALVPAMLAGGITGSNLAEGGLKCAKIEIDENKPAWKKWLRRGAILVGAAGGGYAFGYVLPAVAAKAAGDAAVAGVIAGASSLPLIKHLVGTRVFNATVVIPTEVETITRVYSTTQENMLPLVGIGATVGGNIAGTAMDYTISGVEKGGNALWGALQKGYSNFKSSWRGRTQKKPENETPLIQV